MINLNRKLEERNLPNVLITNNGKVVDKANMWPSRRRELIGILSSQVYGFSPPAPPNIGSVLLERDDNAFAGKAEHSLMAKPF